jgi:malic enzyme
LVEAFDLAAGLWVIRAGVDVVDAELAENDLQGGAPAASWCGGEDGAVVGEHRGRGAPAGPLLPAWSDVPDVAVRIAHAVAVQAVMDGVAPKRSGDELTERIAQVRWTPEYPTVPA